MVQNRETPKLTTDCVINVDGGIVLIRRGNDPFKGGYAIPGGFVEVGETVEQACKREMQEETGLVLKELRLAGVYSDPERDPRGHTASVVFYAESDGQGLRAGDDASEIEVLSDFSHITLAFDHKQILQDTFRKFDLGHTI